MVEELRKRSIGLIRAGRPIQAVLALRRAIEIDLWQAQSYHLLGVALMHAGQLAAAEANLRHAVLLDPTLADAYQDLGVALEKQGRDLDALEVYGQVIALEPKRTDTHRRIGELLHARGQIDRAREAYTRGVEAAADTTKRRLLRAKALMLDNKVQDAELLLRRVVAVDRSNSGAQSDLAEALVAQGQFAEGVKCYERALKIDPRHARAWYGYALATRFSDADRCCLAAMRSALASVTTDEARIFLHAAIGKFCDDVGDYEGAMRHFDTANQLRRKKVQFDKPAFAAHIERLIGRFTSQFFVAHADLGIADELPLLIVGMPRSGTTLVEQIVSSHPAISAGGELVHWTTLDVPIALMDETNITRAAAHASSVTYLNILRKISTTASRVTDKLPFNFLSLGLIHLLLPGARIIHCRRSPVDTCLSIYSTLFEGRMEFATTKKDLVFYYRQYERLMRHWRTVLPAHRFLEVRYERLIADREAETRRLIAFAGIDWDDACLLPEQNNRVVRTASVWQARQPVYASSVERWRRYEPWLGELATLV